MTTFESIKGKIKEFKPTSWVIDNKTSVYLLIIFVTILGVNKFVTTPKEQFPDIVIPTIYVQTTYVGNSPKDIQKLIPRPI
jgi:multidrug efflux pump subunit AcrB